MWLSFVGAEVCGENTQQSARHGYLPVSSQLIPRLRSPMALCPLDVGQRLRSAGVAALTRASQGRGQEPPCGLSLADLGVWPTAVEGGACLSLSCVVWLVFPGGHASPFSVASSCSKEGSLIWACGPGGTA